MHGRDRLKIVSLDREHGRADFALAVRDGLEAHPKHLPCRYFYDDIGSRLFEQICDLPEYYLTRAEREVLARHGDEIVGSLVKPTTMVELGSGNSEKTRLLISALLRRHRRTCYVPVDISKRMLEETSRSLLADYMGLDIVAVAGEYGTALEWLREKTSAPRLVLWLGSSIGNFGNPEAVRLLTEIARGLSDDDRVLVGADLRKDIGDLIRAYDDAAGVTAAFNKNLLVRINRELGGSFDPDAFRHEARWNAEESRVEMHLVSTRPQRVWIDAIGTAVEFAAEESIHTEDSHKYAEEEIATLSREAGLAVETVWHDRRRRFCVTLLARTKT